MSNAIRFFALSACLLAAGVCSVANEKGNGAVYGTIEELRGVKTYAIHVSGGCEKIKNAIIKGVKDDAPELRLVDRGSAGVILALHYIPADKVYEKDAKDPAVAPLGQSKSCREIGKLERATYILRGYAVKGGRILWSFEPKTSFSTPRDFGDEFAKVYRTANNLPHNP